MRVPILIKLQVLTAIRLAFPLIEAHDPVATPLEFVLTGVCPRG